MMSCWLEMAWPECVRPSLDFSGPIRMLSVPSLISWFRFMVLLADSSLMGLVTVSAVAALSETIPYL